MPLSLCEFYKTLPTLLFCHIWERRLATLQTTQQLCTQMHPKYILRRIFHSFSMLWSNLNRQKCNGEGWAHKEKTNTIWSYKRSPNFYGQRSGSSCENTTSSQLEQDGYDTALQDTFPLNVIGRNSTSKAKTGSKKSSQSLRVAQTTVQPCWWARRGNSFASNSKIPPPFLCLSARWGGESEYI